MKGLQASRPQEDFLPALTRTKPKARVCVCVHVCVRVFVCGWLAGCFCRQVSASDWKRGPNLIQPIVRQPCAALPPVSPATTPHSHQVSTRSGILRSSVCVCLWVYRRVAVHMGFQPCTRQANVQISRCVSAVYYSATSCPT